MPAEAICCAVCSWPFDAELWNRAGAVRCPSCGSPVQVAVFPAVERTGAGTLPEKLGAESEASCFYHPFSRAVVPCDQCGRFLCSLCDLDIDGRHLCPACLLPGPGAQRTALIDPRRTMYDTVVLLVATV